jgi:hypothetical protein
MNKVKGIKTDNFEELINKINEFNSNNKVFASQVYPNFGNGMWYGVIHYESQQDKTISKDNSTKDFSLSGKHIDGKGVMDKTVDNSPTDKQLFFLKKMGVTIPKTKQEATKMIKRLKDLE